MKKLWHKLVQGTVTAATAVTAAFLGVNAMGWHFAGWPAVLRVGAPAFVVGMLFFPLDVRTLGNRWRFVARAVVASVASCAVHRVLLGSAIFGADELLRDPAILLPRGLDDNFLLALMATGGAGLAAWLFQPGLLRLARGALPARIERISDDLQAVPVRHRVR